MLPMIISIRIPHMLHLEGKLFESLGCLVLVRRDCIGSSKFTIYQMRKGCYVWSSKYIVNTDDFMNPLPEGWSIRSIVWSIVLGEREEDSFIIINLSAKNQITRMLIPMFMDVLGLRLAFDPTKSPYYKVMMKGSSVWSVRYHVDTDDFMTPLPEGWSIRSTVWSIVLEEREDDSFSGADSVGIIRS
ncbi:hypothetical protein Tco_0746891 [Tanacetum coccineum]